MDATLLAILQLVVASGPQLLNLAVEAVDAFKANDQAALDAVHQKATDQANALKPAGV